MSSIELKLLYPLVNLPMYLCGSSSVCVFPSLCVGFMSLLLVLAIYLKMPVHYECRRNSLILLSVTAQPLYKITHFLVRQHQLEDITGIPRCYLHFFPKPLEQCRSVRLCIRVSFALKCLLGQVKQIS